MLSDLWDQVQGLVPMDKINNDLFGGIVTPESIRVMKNLFSSLSSSVREGESGKGTLVPARVGRLIEDWNRNNDTQVARGLTEASQRRWFERRDALQRAMHPQWGPKALKVMTEGKGPHYERFIANMLLHKDTKALKAVNGWLRRKGLGRGDPNSRRNQANAAMADEVYSLATDLGPHSRWQSLGGPDKSAQAMLQLIDIGGLQSISSQAGMFDRAGGMTDMGRNQLKRNLNSLGSGLSALQSWSRTKMNAVEIMQKMAAPDQLGIKFFQQLADPTMSARLHSFNRMATNSGLSPNASLSLFKNTRKLFRTNDARPVFNHAEQMLAMMHEAHNSSNPAAGDDERRHKLMVLATDRARRSSTIKVASAGAAALEPTMGRAAAWNYADNALRSTRNSKQLLYKLNIQLDHGSKITRDNFQSVLAAPEAYEYFASGRPVGFAIQRTNRNLANYLKRNSRFLARHADRIMKDRGRVDMATVASWMKEKGASPYQIGGTLQRLRKIGPHLALKLKFPGALSSDDVFGYVSSASHNGARQKFIDDSNEYGEEAVAGASTHARKGWQAGIAAMLSGKTPAASAMETITGSDRRVNMGAENRVKTPPAGTAVPKPGWNAPAYTPKTSPEPEISGANHPNVSVDSQRRG